MTPEEREIHKRVSALNIKSVVNEPEWQKLREGLVGTWKKTPDHNVELLRRYLGGKVMGADPMKLRRVHNYLTGSGFRIGIISSSAITKLREEVRKARGMEEE